MRRILLRGPHIIVSLPLLLVALFVTGCNGETVDISKLVAERDSLRESLLSKEQESDNMNLLWKAISDGLDSIAIQEGYILDAGSEGTGMNRNLVKKNLQGLADMLARQRARISALEDSLNLNSGGASELHNIINYLNSQLTAKENTINQLRREIGSKNLSLKQMQQRLSIMDERVDSIGKITQIQGEIIVTQDSIMNECYVRIGSKKELKRIGILNGSKLNPNALTPDKFVSVNIREMVEIPIQSKSPKILTTMPKSAYRIVRHTDGTSTLFIDDPTSFWRSSNYLVIQE